MSEQISYHFKRSEFACKCGCGFDSVDAELLGILVYLRRYYGKAIIITSGNRCIDHNIMIGGSAKSRHLRGIAADFKVQGIDQAIVQTHLLSLYPNQYGIGSYVNFTHLDVDEKIRRWIDE